MPKALYRTGALLALALLAGCAGIAPVVTHQDLDVDFYRTSILNAATVDGTLPATVVGAPVAGAGAADALAPLRLPATINAHRLVPGKDEGVRLVILYHPKAAAAGDRACAPADSLAPLVTAPAAGAAFTAQVVLCQGRRRVSTALVTGPAIAGLADPAYADTLMAALVTILPSLPIRGFTIIN
ncbi:hypothetical protein [Zavarzinia compransoris]|uniref:DUF3124 domain-containing protein n=1 Tax=Zavarzinia compransoris TaxID=1264899 RepID=A0A317EB07_9PROT|nr:hypothetical protein [Zavarzinia compransoris]PWR23881.1 hypothetical protein DKG75_04840 [Zavarzinia compransoris]TDP48123.1 hypothetical protein DES42_102425 [Zavarzinia compransoris]